MLVYLGIISIVLGGTLANPTLEDGLDQVVNSAKSSIQETYAIPDINVNYTTPSADTPLNGKFVATSGTVKGLSQLARFGNVEVNKWARRAFVKTHMYLAADVEMFYPHYDFEIGNVKSSGQVTIKSYEPQIYTFTEVQEDDKGCHSELTAFHIRTFGKFTINMSGTPDNLAYLGLQWAEGQLENGIRSVANSHLRAAIQQGLTKVNLCKILFQ